VDASHLFTLAVCAALGLQLLYILFVFRAFFALPKVEGEPAASAQPLSVVVCARNELENLQKHLPLWLAQEHPAFEWVVVNDRSWDESQEWLESVAERDPRLRIVEIKDNDRFWFGKNFALTLGIKAAKYDRLVLTDADGVPESRDWLRRMDAALRTPHDLVLGYGPYRTESSWISWVSAFDALQTAVHYFGWSGLGKPYMGVGRNMAYHRALFMANKGFSGHMDVISSDDDLFVAAVATPDNHRALIDPKAMVWSEAPEDFKAWWHQKKRHLLAAPRYRPLHRYGLGLWGLSTFLIYALAMGWAFWGTPLAGYLLLGRFVVVTGVFYAAGRRLGTPKPAWVLFPAELGIVVSQAVLLIANRFGPKLKNW